MTHNNATHQGKDLFVITASIVVIFYGINQAQSVVSLFLLSVFIALIATPPVLWMEKKRVPKIIAVMIVIITLITLLLMVGGIVGASLSSFSDALPFYQKRLQEEVLSLKPLLTSKHIIVTDKVLLEYFNPGPIMGLVVGMLSEMGAALSSILLILLTVIFILIEASSFPVKIRSVLGDPKRVFPQFTKFVYEIKRYMMIKTSINLIAGTLIAFWLIILGVDFPVLWGFLTFLFLYIPNVGSVIAALPAVLLALTQHGGGTAALTAFGYFAVGTILGKFLEPRIMGRRLGMSTLVVFLSMIFWGNLLGPIGVVLCIPMTMTLKFAFENNERTAWIAVLLGPEIPADSTKVSQP
ncbi:MAG: AI-2E family transporter [Bacteroidota bacterium]